jgi:hypothetical protein
MGKWTEGRPEKTEEFLTELNGFKDIVMGQLSELKAKRAELVQEKNKREQELKEKGNHG